MVRNPLQVCVEEVHVQSEVNASHSGLWKSIQLIVDIWRVSNGVQQWINVLGGQESLERFHRSSASVKR